MKTKLSSVRDHVAYDWMEMKGTFSRGELKEYLAGFRGPKGGDYSKATNRILYYFKTKEYGLIEHRGYGLYEVCK